MTTLQVLQKMIQEFDIKIPNDLDNTETTQMQQPHTQKTSLRGMLLSKHLNIPENSTSTLESELLRFAAKKEICDDVLMFWKINENVYPKMASIAKIILGIPATTSKSESAFSVSGSLIRSKRARIEPFRAEKVLFIHDNYDLIKRK